MRRRLTFAPSFRRGVQASSTAAEEEDSEEDDERRCAEGRAELSRSVALVAAACRRPSPQSLPFKFWAQSSEGSEAEEGNHDDHSTPEVVDLIHGDRNSSSEPSTPVFVREALEAGFTIDQLSRAEKALDSGMHSGDVRLAYSIVSTMVQRKLAERPWKGQLPPRRISPPRTLGDAMATVSYQRSSKSRQIGSPAERHIGGGANSSPSPAQSTPTRDVQSSKNFEIPKLQCIDPDFPPLSPVKLPVDLTACGTSVDRESTD